MRTVTNVLIGILVATLTSAAVLGQDATLTDRASQPLVERSEGPGLRNLATNSIKPENLKSYHMGFDFEAATLFIELGDTAKAIQIARILRTGLAGTPEATQVEMALGMLSQNEGRAAMFVLEMAQIGFEKGLNVEPKWFYNVGKTYGQVLGYLALEKPTESKLNMVELAGLARTAPVGTPTNLLNAMAKLGEYGAKSVFTNEDLAGMAAEWDNLEAAVTA